MTKISIYLAVGMAVVAGLGGWAAGYWLTPEYKLSMYEKNGMTLGPADRGFDLRYINAMAAHHRGAMLLGEQAKQSGRKEIQDLSAAIEKGEPVLIEELYGWKRAWYGDSRKVRDPIVAKLGPVDEKFDLRFLNALIAHHEAGIEMTKETRLKSSRAEVLNNADAVEAFLAGGVQDLKALRSAWYNI